MASVFFPQPPFGFRDFGNQGNGPAKIKNGGPTNPTNPQFLVYVLKLPPKNWIRFMDFFFPGILNSWPLFFFFTPRDFHAFSPRLQEIPSDGWPRLLSEEEVE